MLDDLREEAIVNKVGGRFKLSTLIQKRMVQLNKGGHQMVDLNTQDRMQIVIEEILQTGLLLRHRAHSAEPSFGGLHA